MNALDVLEIFAEAQLYGPQQTRAVVLAGGFVMPQVGKSGLTRPKLTESERKAKRAEISRKQFARKMADPEKAAHVREMRRLRVQRFRARQASKSEGR